VKHEIVFLTTAKSAIKPNWPISVQVATIRLVDDSKKGHSYGWKHNVEIKNTVLEMTAAGLD